jgi:hypothetical protein
MTPLIGVENLMVDPDFSVPRTEQTAGSGFQSRSSAGSPGTSGADKTSGMPGKTKAAAKTGDAASSRLKGQAAQAQEPEPRPMEPSRVIEVQFFKDGVLGRRLNTGSPRANGHIDIEA